MHSGQPLAYKILFPLQFSLISNNERLVYYLNQCAFVPIYDCFKYVLTCLLDSFFAQGATKLKQIEL